MSYLFGGRQRRFYLLLGILLIKNLNNSCIHANYFFLIFKRLIRRKNRRHSLSIMLHVHNDTAIFYFVCTYIKLTSITAIKLMLKRKPRHCCILVGLSLYMYDFAGKLSCQYLEAKTYSNRSGFIAVLKTDELYMDECLCGIFKCVYVRRFWKVAKMSICDVLARNPPPICAAIPFLKDYVSLCVRFSDLTIADTTFSGKSVVMISLSYH